MFDNNETPKFNDSAKIMKIDNQEFTIYYSPECPYVEYEVKELTDYAKEKKIDINFVKLILLKKQKMHLAYSIIGQISTKENSFLILY